ncbi:trypsin-like peptidase domain-containing protein [Glaciecola sp. KUL10]|uniref:trypsin-like peptidase domain-containing protein n=1 Tax=Glaciecola sp. (strain KUL10) TaxID=2161813 RepID=UPI0011B6AE92|nr:trypsin-like peptidase domain-containing protein [Glaciecola sp. KUL10]
MKTRFTRFSTYIKSVFLISVMSISGFVNANDIVDAVVNIEFNKVRAWDDGYNSSGVGTGFVIDAERGLILTNKHLLNVAPVIAFAEFSNKQTIQLIPVYRDPVHDFGVFKYDPSALNGLSVEPIELSRQAVVGESIKLYGNDGGEALSIIEGVLSRLDRPSPNYNSTNSDYNTFYFQAALGSSGGSSGSPILNEKNQAIALNAGGRRDTAAAFFVPMQMIVPTINKLLNNEPITRGTLQTVFRFEPYNQLRKIGWDDARIKLSKESMPQANGLLVVEQIATDSPADTKLQVGDLLLSLDEQVIPDFFTLESYLNEHVGQTIKVTVERASTKQSFDIEVSDLFALLPDEYIEYGDTIIIPIGLATARLFNVAATGVMVVDPGRLFGSQNIRPLAKIDEVNGKPIENLEQLAEQFKSIQDGEKFSLRYRYLYDASNQEYKQIRDYSKWFNNQHCQSELGELLWACTAISKVNDAPYVNKVNRKNTITSPIVDVEVFRPLAVNMSTDVTRRGHGVVVDKSDGLIIADKTLIDSTLSQVQVILNNGVSLPAEVLAIHPYLNMVLLKAPLDGLRFGKKVVPKVSDTVPTEDEELTLKSKSFFKDFTASVESGWPTVANGAVPFDSMEISKVPAAFSIYVDRKNRLVAIAPGFSDTRISNSVIPAPLINRFVKSIEAGDDGLFELKDRLDYISYAQALEFGLQEIEGQAIERKVSVSKAAELEQSGLKSGDLILQVAGKALTSLNQLHNSVDASELAVQVLRNGSPENLALKTKFSSFKELDEVLVWGGSIIHEIPLNVPTPNGVIDTCVRIGVRYFGAPIYAAKASGPFCVYSVDGVLVKTLAQLKALISGKAFGEYTTLKVINLDKNYRLDEYRVTEETYYWPTRAFTNTKIGWVISKAPF